MKLLVNELAPSRVGSRAAMFCPSAPFLLGSLTCPLLVQMRVQGVDGEREGTRRAAAGSRTAAHVLARVLLSYGHAAGNAKVVALLYDPVGCRFKRRWPASSAPPMN